MKKAERARTVQKTLDEFLPEPPIPLRHRDAYTLLIAVLLSAQCTDDRVNQVTPRLFALADTPEDMAALEESRILEIVRPCGLGPRKAKAIHELSRILRDQYNGQVPQTLEELEALPGVGHKTAQVVLTQAFQKPAFPVDTHIHRCAQRWGLTSGKSVKQTEIDLKRTFPPESWNRLHLQIIYFARAECTARTICDGSENACSLCPILNSRRKNPFKARKA